MEESGLDIMINHLLEKGCRWENNDFLFFNSEIQQLHQACKDIFIKEPVLLQLKPPVKIAGNIHGQYNALLSIFEHGGLPPQSTYLFLGNYNGTPPGHDLETILLLLAFKMKYPKNLFLLKGNLDSLDQHLLDEVEIHSFRLLYIYECFACLPVAALINNKILCSNGCLSPNLRSLDQIRNIKRGADGNSYLLNDLLGRPIHDDYVRGDVVNKFPFSCSKEVKKFLEKHDLHLICCGYEAVGGYEVSDEQRLVYICSARSGEFEYSSQSNFGKVGAMMSVDANLRYSFHILKPKGRVWSSYNNQPENSPVVNYTMKKLAESMRKPNPGSSSVTMNSKSSEGISSSKFDPNSLYRSKSPGVKRFLGAKV